jgi:hypothetical protein
MRFAAAGQVWISRQQNDARICRSPSGGLARPTHLHNSAHVDNKRHRTITQDGRAGNALDPAIVGFQRLDDSLLLTEQVIDQ